MKQNDLGTLSGRMLYHFSAIIATCLSSSKSERKSGNMMLGHPGSHGWGLCTPLVHVVGNLIPIHTSQTCVDGSRGFTPRKTVDKSGTVEGVSDVGRAVLF